MLELKFGKDNESICGVQICPVGNWTVIIVTELDENKGLSITNGIDILIPKVLKMFELEKGEVVWIEHFKADPRYPGIFAEVDMWSYVKLNSKFQHPSWQALTEDQVEEICRGENSTGKNILLFGEE